MNSIRVLLSLVANLDWPLQQFDVKNTFLHENLEEEVFMDLHPSFEGKFSGGKVCRLKKSLYGLKQSPQAWKLGCKLAGTPIDQNHQLGTITEGIVVDKRVLYFYGWQLGYLEKQKQHVVARSSAEAEFQAMALGICELMWLKGLLRELQVNLENPMRPYCGNKSTINIAHNPVQHDRTKHVKIGRHFIKEKIDSGLICTPFVASKLQLANVFTKGVQNPTFNSMVDGYPVYSMATPTITGAKEMELNKPVDTLKHVGITGPVVEHMEARLKEDILSECSVIGYWENIFVDDVKTPAEVYAALKDEGYNIAHRRIPLTREREALASDVDAIQYCKDECCNLHSSEPAVGSGDVIVPTNPYEDSSPMGNKEEKEEENNSGRAREKERERELFATCGVGLGEGESCLLLNFGRKWG
ncbi:Copia protein [Vitis vinifera]|uniref:Copia protein n=1 Tax=Vitis vinifera TaxID=29760 RepID=A0A438D0S8_VITVI|nr:Copia protein [Vitis vinifera]